MNNTAITPARRSIAFIGANAGLALHPVDAKGGLVPGEPASCFASFWMSDWSRWGAGNALLVATSLDSFDFAAAGVERDRETVTCLRSVLMKPEYREWVPRIWEILDRATDAVLGAS